MNKLMGIPCGRLQGEEKIRENLKNQTSLGRRRTTSTKFGENISIVVA